MPGHRLTIGVQSMSILCRLYDYIWLACMRLSLKKAYDLFHKIKPSSNTEKEYQFVGT